MALSAAVANDIANYICRGTAPTALTTPVKMSLHTADPGATGANEATGGSYARSTGANVGGLGPYNAASGSAAALNSTVSFTGLAAGTYTHIGLWDSSGTPKFLQGSAMAASQTVSAGATINITAATNTIAGA